MSLGGAYDGFFNAVPDFGNGLFLGAVLVQEVALHDAGINDASANVYQDFDYDLGADIATVCFPRVFRRGNTNGRWTAIGTGRDRVVSRVGTFYVLVVRAGFVDVQGYVGNLQFNVIEHNVVRHDDGRLGNRRRRFALLLGSLLDLFDLNDFLATGIESGATEIKLGCRPEKDARVYDQQAQGKRAEEVEEVALPSDRIFLKLVQEVLMGLLLYALNTRSRYVDRSTGVRYCCRIASAAAWLVIVDN